MRCNCAKMLNYFKTPTDAAVNIASGPDAGCGRVGEACIIWS